MKAKTLLALLLLVSSFTYAQDTLLRENALSNTITERYSVLKANKKLKQGEYIAFTKSGVLARGRYQNGKRVGEWIFGTFRAKLAQTYNYDSSKVTGMDDSNVKTYKYSYNEAINPGDIVVNPVKIGGHFYSLVPMMTAADLMASIAFDFPESSNMVCYHIFTVAPTGELIKHAVHIKTDTKEKTYTVKDREFDADFKQFVPATINGRPVECNVTIPLTMGIGTNRSELVEAMKQQRSH